MKLPLTYASKLTYGLLSEVSLPFGVQNLKTEVGPQSGRGTGFSIGTSHKPQVPTRHCACIRINKQFADLGFIVRRLVIGRTSNRTVCCCLGAEPHVLWHPGISCLRASRPN